jgi:uncharacterized protein YndB with AHSA1/START domain
MTEQIGTAMPVVSKKEIEIAAPPEVVWRLLTALDHWPTWNPEVKSMSAPELVAVGSTFRWKAGPGTITSTIRRLEPFRLIAWSGRTMGIRAVDVFHLDSRDGSTLVREEESWDGLVARLFRKSLQRTLDRSLVKGLHHLKAAAEQR